MSDARILYQRKVIFALLLITLQYEVCSNVAPWTGASVFCCTLFFCVNNVFCNGSMNTFTRDELINIRTITPMDLFPDFITSTKVLMYILAKGALTFAHSSRRRWCRRGKRAGVLAHLWQREYHTLLPGIFLSNVCSLCNKLDELQLQLGKNSDLSASSVMCSTETWHHRPTCRRCREGSRTRYNAWSKLIRMPQLLSWATLTKVTSHTNFPNVDSVLNAQPERRTLWITVTPQ